MHRITIKDVLKTKNDRALVLLEYHVYKNHIKSLKYDYQLKAYTIHTEEGTSTTDDVKEAVKLYNTG